MGKNKHQHHKKHDKASNNAESQQQKQKSHNQDNDDHPTLSIDEQITYWKDQCADLNLEVETAKMEADEDLAKLEHDQTKLKHEQAMVSKLLHTFESKNSHLSKKLNQMQQKTHDQAFELTNKQNQIDILNQKLQMLVEEEEQRKNQPNLSIQEYAKQLADHGDTATLSTLHSNIYSQISFLVQQQQMAQMMQQMNVNGAAPNGTAANANGPTPQQNLQQMHIPPMQGMPPQMMFQNQMAPFAQQQMFGAQQTAQSTDPQQQFVPNFFQQNYMTPTSSTVSANQQHQKTQQ